MHHRNWTSLVGAALVMAACSSSDDAGQGPGSDAATTDGQQDAPAKDAAPDTASRTDGGDAAPDVVTHADSGDAAPNDATDLDADADAPPSDVSTGDNLDPCTYPDGLNMGECVAAGFTCVWNGSCDPGPNGSPPNCGTRCVDCAHPPTNMSQISCAALDGG